MKPCSGIIAGGRRQLRRDPAFAATCAAIRQKARAEFEQQAAGLGTRARFRLWWRMRRQVRARLRALAPKRALYARR